MDSVKKQHDLSPAWTLGIYTFLQLLDYIDRSILLAMLSPIKAEFNLSDGQVGDINASFMFGYMIFSPFFAYFGDRSPRKYLILLGVLVWSFGTWAGGWSIGILTLLGARFLVSLGEASFGAIGSSVISDKFSGPRRNTALTIFYATIPVGYALGYILGGYMHKHPDIGWREALGWVGVPGIFAALLLLPFKEPERGALDEKDATHSMAALNFSDLKNFWRTQFFIRGIALGAMIFLLSYVTGLSNVLSDFIFGKYIFQSPMSVFHALFGFTYIMLIFFLKQMWSLFKNKNYMLTVLGYCAYTAALGAYSVWGPQFMERVHGLKNAGEMFGILLLGASIPGTLLGGFWASRMRAKYENAYAIVIAVTVLLSAPIVVMAFTVSSLFLAQVFMGLAILLIFASTGPVNTLIIETVPVNMRCMAMAASIFLIHILGDLWSPSLVGRVSDATGQLKFALMLLPIFLLIAAIFWLKLAFDMRKIKIS